MKILIIEDNKLLADSIKKQLNGQYIVDVVHTGEQGIEQARSAEYGVILLDLGLPDIDGHDVCYELRNQGVGSPILVLSGIRDAEHRVRLLECGADDYLTKPFYRDELRARIAALLRRNVKTPPTRQLKIDDLILDLDRRRVIRAGVPITLRRKEFDILEYLIQNRGHTVTRDMIFNHAWEAGKDGWNNTVDVHIKHLRDKVDRPFKKALIKTTYGIGYMVDETG